jgi:adenylate cyclase
MNANTEQRKLAAIVFTDMVGYSALAQRDDKLALELLEEHRELLREIFPRFNGTEIKTIGDGFLVEFNSALEAAQCAIEIQRALSKRNHDVPAERRIELRIGIHIGDVVHRSGDVYGDGVNIASRIEQLAGPGGICVSMDVERQIRNALEARFEKLAPTELKNISVPMDLFRIVLPWEQTRSETGRGLATTGGKKFVWIGAIVLAVIGFGWWWSERPSSNPTKPIGQTSNISPSPVTGEKSIAVLPFENLSRDPENAYFAEAMQGEILARLSKIADLKVISRTSTQKYKSAPDNLREIAKQLGVANIVEGSVQKAIDRVRVNVQLINALNDTHLWGDIYDRQLTDIFTVESDIASTIADTLQAKLTGAEKQLIAAKPTSDLTAYELYLKGRLLWSKRGGENVRQAIAFYEQAIARDPTYALAYAGLAEAYMVLPRYAEAAPQETYPKAKAAALKALQLDDKLAEAHNALGFVLWVGDFDMAGSISEFQRAIALDPNSANAHKWYGNPTLAASGRFDEAIKEIKRAAELDPLSTIIHSDLGWTLILARRYDQAIAQLYKTLELDPTFYYAHLNLGLAFQLKGDLSGAIAEYTKAQQLSDDPEIRVRLAAAKAHSGDKQAAAQMLEELEELSRQRYAHTYWRALLYLSLRNHDKAIRWLEKGISEHEGRDINWIKVDPLLDPLRGDPRFEALVQKVVAPK